MCVQDTRFALAYMRAHHRIGSASAHVRFMHTLNVGSANGEQESYLERAMYTFERNKRG